MWAMLRRHYFIREDQIKFLKSLPGNASGYIRQALDDFIIKKSKETLQVSTSASKK